MSDTDTKTSERGSGVAEPNTSFADRIGNGQAIAKVINAACRRAVAERGRVGLPAVVWRNVQVMRLQPAEILQEIPSDKSNWIDAISGSAKDDPEFREILGLEKESREAERPPDA